MGRGMCVDTRVIPIALGEHTLITLTYLWGACVPHLPACARVCMRACVCEGITMCMCITYACGYCLPMCATTHTKTLRHLTILYYLVRCAYSSALPCGCAYELGFV